MKAAFLFALLCWTARGVQPACAATPAVARLDIEMCWAEHYARAFGVPLEIRASRIDVESAWHEFQRDAERPRVVLGPTHLDIESRNRWRRRTGWLNAPGGPT